MRYSASRAAALFAAGAAAAMTTLPTTAMTLRAPNSSMTVRFALSESGRPQYAILLADQVVIATSGMGLEVSTTGRTITKESFFDGFEIQKTVERREVDEVWKTVWGEEEEIRNSYREMLVHLIRPNQTHSRRMSIRFRVFDHGVGFRYEFPSQPNLIHYDIVDEKTEFAMTGDHVAWWIPGDYDTQEWNYQCSSLSEIRHRFDDALEDNVSATQFSPTGVQTALLMRTESGLYINIHEAALVNYSCMHLDLDDSRMVFVSHLTPDAVGVKAHLQTPNVTPWRTIVASFNASDILASRITYNLNDPPDPNIDWSWVKPIKYIGVWWELITGHRRWDYTDDLHSVQIGQTDYSAVKPHGKHGATTQRVLEYIDFAAEHSFDAVLVEGWNVGWEDWFGHQKEYVFDFVTPYPDYNISFITDYARQKSIQIIMHHETSGSTRNYERHLHRAYGLMHQYGLSTVKSGYVGNILPHGQYHYSQDSIDHYLYCVKEAIPFRISVNAHEAVRPTGLGRTYPNLIANEAARGQEYQAFNNGNHPNHVTILPFTRQIGGPMDYTPGILNMHLSAWVTGDEDRQESDWGPQCPGEEGEAGMLGGEATASAAARHVKSTIANQLGLFVTMYSPLQMAADTIENYAVHLKRAFQFIKDVPVTWRRSVYLEAVPGSYVTIARQDRHSDAWYIGNVNGILPRFADISLHFLQPGETYRGIVYSDSPTAHYRINPHAYDIRLQNFTREDSLNLWTASGGGFAVSLHKAG